MEWWEILVLSFVAFICVLVLIYLIYEIRRTYAQPYSAALSAARGDPEPPPGTYTPNGSLDLRGSYDVPNYKVREDPPNEVMLGGGFQRIKDRS